MKIVQQSHRRYQIEMTFAQLKCLAWLLYETETMNLPKGVKEFVARLLKLLEMNL